MNTVPYSKVWEFLRCYMNNPSLMPTRSQKVSDLLYNGYKSCRRVVRKLNRYCKDNGISTKFKSHIDMTLGELMDQAEPLQIEDIMAKRILRLQKSKGYVY